jgi:hypothetical protein
MNERVKIAEAEFFPGQLQAVTAQADPSREQVTHLVSAFSTAARSALQYALDEAQSKRGGQAWYAAMVARFPVIRYFRDLRNVNIHERPVVPHRHVSVNLSETVRVGEQLGIGVRDKDGNVVNREVVSNQPATPMPSTAEVLTAFFFSDWTETKDDVPGLCAVYLDALKEVVAAGIEAGFVIG